MLKFSMEKPNRNYRPVRLLDSNQGKPFVCYFEFRESSLREYVFEGKKLDDVICKECFEFAKSLGWKGKPILFLDAKLKSRIDKVEVKYQ